MTPAQTGAAIAALSAQLDGMQAALDATRATLAVLSLDAEAALASEATDDPATCAHPRVLNVSAGADTQQLCESCGLNLTVPQR